MLLIVTPLTAAVLVFMYVRLTLNVVAIRRSDQVSLGDNNNSALQKAIRAHGNLAEWAPLALVLLAVLEINAVPVWLTALTAIGFVAGRVLHPQGILSPADGGFKKRVLGMQLTIFSVIAMAALSVIWMLYRLLG